MSKLTTPVSATDHQRGNPKAAVTLVEYGDYQCGYCAEAHKLIKPLLKEFGTDLLFVFRNFPVPEFHPKAMTAALGAEAANNQGKFWELHDLLYEHGCPLLEDSLLSYAKKLGLDLEKFEADMKAGDTKARVRVDMESGTHSGVNGTPTFFINGNRLYSYDRTYESLANAVKRLEKI